MTKMPKSQNFQVSNVLTSKMSVNTLLLKTQTWKRFSFNIVFFLKKKDFILFLYGLELYNFNWHYIKVPCYDLSLHYNLLISSYKTLLSKVHRNKICSARVYWRNTSNNLLLLILMKPLNSIRQFDKHTLKKNTLPQKARSFNHKLNLDNIKMLNYMAIYMRKTGYFSWQIWSSEGQFK